MSIQGLLVDYKGVKTEPCWKVYVSPNEVTSMVPVFTATFLADMLSVSFGLHPL